MNNFFKVINKFKFVIIVFILFLLILFLFLNSNKSNEEELKEYLEIMGRNYYENKIYEELSSINTEGDSFLEKYSKTGIKFDLFLLESEEINKEYLKKFINFKTKEECDKEKNMVYVYPFSPYGKKDYNIKLVLDC